MKGWLNNALQFIKTGSHGACPECGSEDIQIEEYNFGRRYSISFLCRSCGSGDHFDGLSSSNKSGTT